MFKFCIEPVALLAAVLLMFAATAVRAKTFEENVAVASQAYDEQDFDKALKYYRMAAKESPDAANVWYNLGLAQEALGQNKDAIESYEKYLDLETDKKAKKEVSEWIDALKADAGENEEKTVPGDEQESSIEKKKIAAAAAAPAKVKSKSPDGYVSLGVGNSYGVFGANYTKMKGAEKGALGFEIGVGYGIYEETGASVGALYALSENTALSLCYQKTVYWKETTYLFFSQTDEVGSLWGPALYLRNIPKEKGWLYWAGVTHHGGYDVFKGTRDEFHEDAENRFSVGLGYIMSSF